MIATNTIDCIAAHGGGRHGRQRVPQAARGARVGGKGRHFNVECCVICWPNVGFEYVILALALALCQR